MKYVRIIVVVVAIILLGWEMSSIAKNAYSHVNRVGSARSLRSFFSGDTSIANLNLEVRKAESQFNANMIASLLIMTGVIGGSFLILYSIKDYK